MKKRISKMSNDEKRIAIAEWCGWTNIEDKPHRGGLTGTTPNTVGFHFEMIPQYSIDLNAMQDAWACLGWEEKNECIEHLKDIVEEADCESYFATASQRAEAFLLTIGYKP